MYPLSPLFYFSAVSLFCLFVWLVKKNKVSFTLKLY